jgi:hypothetical protein
MWVQARTTSCYRRRNVGVVSAADVAVFSDTESAADVPKPKDMPKVAKRESHGKVLLPHI